MSTSHLRRPLVALAAAAAAVALMVSIIGAGRASAADSSVYVVHGIPGVPVDVYAGSVDPADLVLAGFDYGETAGPLSLPEGDLRVIVTVAGDPSTVLIDQTLGVPGGADLSVVADLVGGAPVLTPFVNDVSAVPAGSGRVTVRHAADAPAVNVLVNGEVAISGLTSGSQESAVLPAGTYDVQVQLTDGTPLPALSPGSVDVTAGVSSIVYATGSATDTDFPLGLVVQEIQVGEEPASTTTSTTSTTPAPAPAAGASASPRFTG